MKEREGGERKGGRESERGSGEVENREQKGGREGGRGDEGRQRDG